MSDAPQTPRAAAPAAGDDAATAQFLTLLARCIDGKQLVKLLLGKPRTNDPAGAQRVQVRPVLLRGQAQLSFLYRHPTRDVTKNLAPREALACIAALLGEYTHAHVLTASADVQWAVTRKGRATLRRGKVAPAAPGAASAAAEVATDAKASGAEAAMPDAGDASDDVVLETLPALAGHDRVKRRPVDVTRPFLTALGVTGAAHRVVPAMARKWKQINRFVEVIAHALDSSPLRDAQRVRVVDFGSGKGYLTFAVHDHLTTARGMQAEVMGVELRGDMVRLCEDAARALQLDGLHFQEGDVRSVAPPEIDVMIALHACDTATDHAIHRGIVSGAAVITCSPCCHKQIRPQMLTPAALRPMLRHGIHLGQEAEMVTDSLRALLLDAHGYDTQVFEFVSLEHTSKNKMILAVRRGAATRAARRDELLAEVAQIKAFYGIREHCLESLLMASTEAA